MMDPHAAGTAEAIGGADRLPIPLGVIAFDFALSCFVFHREAPRVAKTCRAMATTDEIENTERTELETLRARVAALEAERAEEIARAHATVEAAQSACTRRGALRQRTWPRGCSCAVCAAGCAARCADRRLPSPLPPCRVPAPKR